MLPAYKRLPARDMANSRVIQHMQQCIAHRALEPDEPLPPLDPLIAKYTTPDPNLRARAAPAAARLAALCPLTTVRLWHFFFS